MARKIEAPIYETSSADLTRSDYRIESEHGVSVFVRCVEPKKKVSAVPVLLLHGARAGCVASFDLDLPGGSLTADLALTGHPVYLMDARGYGYSTRLDEMSRDPDQLPPLVRSDEVVTDIERVVEFILRDTGRNRLAVMGWATGSQWLAHFSSVRPDLVSHLILYNSLWPVRGPWPMGDALEDSRHPGHLRPGAPGGYGRATAESLLGRWEESIPVSDPDTWRDPDIAAEYARTATTADPMAAESDPPSLRTPLGAMADSFLLSRGHRLFDPAKITANVLIVRSELDFWSRQIDVDAATRDLTHAHSVHAGILPGATHFAHLDRPEHGRSRLIELLTSFLSS